MLTKTDKEKIIILTALRRSEEWVATRDPFEKDDEKELNGIKKLISKLEKSRG